MTVLLVSLVVPLCMWSATTSYLSTHGLLLPIVVMWMAWFAADTDVLHRLGGSKFFIAGADYSLAIFFLHWPLYRVLDNEFNLRGWDDPLRTWQFTLTYAVVLLLCMHLLKRSVDLVASTVDRKIKATYQT